MASAHKQGWCCIGCNMKLRVQLNMKLPDRESRWQLKRIGPPIVLYWCLLFSYYSITSSFVVAGLLAVGGIPAGITCSTCIIVQHCNGCSCSIYVRRSTTRKSHQHMTPESVTEQKCYPTSATSGNAYLLCQWQLTKHNQEHVTYAKTASAVFLQHQKAHSQMARHGRSMLPGCNAVY